MNDTLFVKQLELATKRGLFLDPRVERRSVNGVAGFYAAADIPANTLLVSYPKDKCLKITDDSLYKPDTPTDIKNLHVALKEFQKGEKSEYYCHFMQFESLNDLKKWSCYFFTESELSFLGSLNSKLLEATQEFNNATNFRVSELLKLEPDADLNLVLQLCLNYASRAWVDSNLLPIIDYANHCDRRGRVRSETASDFVLLSKVDYREGDQIFISYGRKDMYFHSVNYNYFDPEAMHSIHFGDRFTQVAKTKRDQDIFYHTSSLFPLQAGSTGTEIHYRCVDPNVCFLESAPTAHLLRYIESNYFPSEQEWNLKRCNILSLHKRLLSILNFLIEANNVEKIDASAVPLKLQRFYQLLSKEKQMLEKNREWVLDSAYA